MSWTKEKLEAICKLDGVNFRKAVFDETLPLHLSVEPEEMLEPANITNSSFKGPESDVPIRIYTPQSDGSSKLPGIVFFHGGGFVFGDLNRYEPVCRRLCVKSGAVIVSVDYRVAPEHPFPAAVNDCYAALEYVYQNADALNIDTSRIGVAGDSAGGNLSTVVSMLARDSKGPSIKYQFLIYPCVDATRNYDNHPVHPGAFLQAFMYTYRHDFKDLKDFRLSPIFGDVTGLPPVWLLLAEYDPLTPEGLDYAEKLKSKGVPTEVLIAKELDHGFINANNRVMPSIVQYQDAAAAAIKKGLA
ncbi:Alpha/Beta hydrolase protein [Umbelopsis sp. PMI_123]|nr:Alpha/Beta hydrolase protein [Umbelopsis sp. PMI_123]